MESISENHAMNSSPLHIADFPALHQMNIFTTKMYVYVVRLNVVTNPKIQHYLLKKKMYSGGCGPVT